MRKLEKESETLKEEKAELREKVSELEKSLFATRKRAENQDHEGHKTEERLKGELSSVRKGLSGLLMENEDLKHMLHCQKAKAKEEIETRAKTTLRNMKNDIMALKTEGKPQKARETDPICFHMHQNLREFDSCKSESRSGFIRNFLNKMGEAESPIKSQREKRQSHTKSPEYFILKNEFEKNCWVGLNRQWKATMDKPENQCQDSLLDHYEKRMTDLNKMLFKFD